jgi:N-acetylmuramoyl-L-alanine amidase
VFYCRKLFWVLALAVAAGCTTPPPRQVPPDVDLSPDQTMVIKPQLAVVPAPKPVSITNPPPAPAPLPAPPQDHINPNETWVPLERWCQASGYSAPRRIANDIAPVYAFSLTNGTMTLRVGSELATWRGMDYHLGFAPEIVNGRPYVNAMDIRKNFMPLLDNPVRLETNRVIVIDPGHGGTDTGASNVVNGHFEKEFTLDLARRLQLLLIADGWTVLLTRTTDVYVPLSSRVAFAEQHKAGLFISLHFNSSFPDRQEAGLETYCLTPHGMHSTLTRGFADNPSLTFPNNNFDWENMQLAARVHREVLKVNGHLDRGVRRARFLGVLQGQNRPGFLVESGYLSNAAEARKIADPAYRQKLAEAIAHGLEQESGSPVNIAAQANPVVSSAPKPAPMEESAKKISNETNGVLTNASVNRQGDGND